MARKGNKRHIKTLNAPKFFGVKSKESSYVAKPTPGRHTLQRSIAISVLLKKTEFVKTTAESSRVIKDHKVKVNGSQISDPKFPVGLNDVIEITPLGKAFDVSINTHGQVSLQELKNPSESSRNCKVVGKYMAKGKQVMLRLHDGSIIKASDNNVKVGDTLVFDKANALKSHIPMKAGSICLVIDGVHTGARGKIVQLVKGNMHAYALATIEQEQGTKFDTLVKNIIVVG